jgi:two-component system, sensor histidine kinase and response regulator
MKHDATKLLVIEDSEPLLSDIVEMLSLEGFDVRSAENGQAGVEAIAAELPDLIVCDIRMPVMDGYSVLDHVRSNPQTAHVPFIFLTARTRRDDMRAGMQLGADDYLMKPFTAEELLSAVYTRLARSQSAKRQTQEQMDQLRQNIVLALPHELRTPLNAVLGFSELLMADAQTLTPDQIHEMAYNINTSSKRLYRLIENYIAYATLEAMVAEPERAAELREGHTDFPMTIVEQVARERAARYERPSDLYLNLDDSMTSLAIDGVYLARIANELIDNAFKFSKTGTPVVISMERVREQFMTIAIADEGRGMSAEDIQSIGAYMQFRRLKLEQQGVGIGMVIAMRLIDLHGGRWHIESKLESHTRVNISLPIATPEDDVTQTRKQPGNLND